MIDFAHVFPANGKLDENYLFGLNNLIAAFENLWVKFKEYNATLRSFWLWSSKVDNQMFSRKLKNRFNFILKLSSCVEKTTKIEHFKIVCNFLVWCIWSDNDRNPSIFARCEDCGDFPPRLVRRWMDLCILDHTVQTSFVQMRRADFQQSKLTWSLSLERS